MLKKPPIFGVTTKEEAQEMAKSFMEAAKKSENPCVRMWGDGPAGRFCGHCKFLIRKPHSYSDFMCELYNPTGTKKYLHKTSWPACIKLEMKNA